MIKAGVFGFLSVLLVFAMSGFANADIFINEFLPNSADTNHEWIELYNNGTAAVSLSGFNISEEAASKNFTISSITIAAKGFIALVRNETVFNQTYRINAQVLQYGNETPSLNLNDGDDSIFLYNSSGSLINSILGYANPGENISIGRHPDGSSNFINLTARTPGGKNDNAAPVLNKWVKPSANNSLIKGMFNVTVNITDAAHAVNISLINFNNTNYTMGRSGDLFYYLWNTSLNEEKQYNITISFNDTLGFSNTDTLFYITVDNTNPRIYNPSTSANSRNFIASGSAFNASANATDANLLNVTCTLSGATTAAEFGALKEAAPFNSSLKGYLDMEARNQTHILDKTGNNNNGEVFGAAAADGEYGDGLLFDGIDDYTEIRAINFSKGMTIEMWVYMQPDTELAQGLMGSGVSNFPGARKWEFYVQTSGAGDCDGRLGWAAGNSFNAQCGSAALSNNTWTHVAVSVDNTTATNNVKFYINGNLDATKSMADALGDAATDRSITLGALRRLSASESFFNGKIDEVRIWNESLSPNEILKRYNLSKSGAENVCRLTAPLAESDFEITFAATDKSGNINTTTAGFTTKYTTSAKLIIKGIAVSDLNLSDKIIEVNATLNNTGNNLIYDTGIILDSFSSTLLSATGVSYQSCSASLNNSQSCSVAFNVTVAGGSTGAHNIFWNANWTDNSFTKRQFESAKASLVTISNSPQAIVTDNVSASIPHGTNATLRVHINSTGNFKLENVNAKFVEGTLKSPLVNATSIIFLAIDKGTNESIDINVAIPRNTNPNNYTGLVNITANGISPKIVKLVVEVPLDNAWTSSPDSTVTYAKSGIAGLAGTFKINNSGNVGHKYLLAKSGNFVFYNLWNDSNPSDAYVEAGEVKSFSIYHMSMEGRTPSTASSFGLTLTITSANTSQSNNTAISLVRDDNNPNVNITSPAGNSFVRGDVIFRVDASDLNLSRIEFYINSSLVLKDANFTRKFNWTSANGSYVDDAYELKAVAYDTAGNFNVSAVNVTLNNSDSKPVFIREIPTISIIEDKDPAILNLSLFFKTIDGDALRYNFTNPNNVTVHVNNGTQIANFTPAENFGGISFIVFTAIDTSNQTASSNNVTIDVANVNDKPKIPILLSPKDKDNISSATGRALLIWEASKDADSDTIIYYVFVSNDSSDIRLNATTTASSLELKNLDSNKKYFWNVLASDSKENSSNTGTFEFVLTGDNKPVINSWRWNNTVSASSANTSPAVAENKTLSFKIDASDPDKDLINFAWFRDNKEVSNAQNFTFDLTNNFTAERAYILKLTVTDNNSNSASQEWQVSVANTNREPVLDDIADKSVTEDSALKFSITASDADNDGLSFSADIGGIVFTKAANNSMANVSWTPTNNNVGDNMVKITANDGSKTDSKIIRITVTNTNDAPIITGFFPKEDRSIAESVGTQKFNVTVADADAGDNTAAYWFRDNAIIASNSSNVTIRGLNKGVYNITAIVNDTSGAAARHEWRLTVTTDIVSENLTSPVLSLNETQRQSAANVTINQSAFGGIDFGNSTLNLTGIVNLEDAFNISRGFISIDTDTYPALKNKPASLLMKGLNFTKAPLIYRAEGFEITSGAALCRTDVCTNISYDAAKGVLRFNAANFSTYFVQTNTTNGAPVIASTAITSAAERATYRYDIDATDPDGNTLVFSLSTAPSGMGISSSTGLITWVPSSSQLGANSVVVNVSDGNLSAGQSFVVNVGKGPRLAISDLDITVDGETDKNANNNSRITEEAKPGSKVEFKIEFENLFSREEGLKIEDIGAEVTIKGIDDGDDLEEEADGIDIRQGKDDSVTVGFEIPLEVEEGDYDVTINAEGEDENNTRHEALFIVKLEVDKEQHEIRVANARISPSTVQCQRQISINAEIINTGTKDEDEVSLEISSPQLEISSLTEGIELDEGTDDNIYAKLLNYRISEDIPSGVYPITIKTRYDNKESDTETLNLEVKDCEKFKDIKKEAKGEKPKEQATKPAAIMQPKASAAGVKQTSSSAKDGRFLVVSILAVIFIGTAIFVIGGAFIVLRK